MQQQHRLYFRLEGQHVHVRWFIAQVPEQSGANVGALVMHYRDWNGLVSGLQTLPNFQFYRDDKGGRGREEDSPIIELSSYTLPAA